MPLPDSDWWRDLRTVVDAALRSLEVAAATDENLRTAIQRLAEGSMAASGESASSASGSKGGGGREQAPEGASAIPSLLPVIRGPLEARQALALSLGGASISVNAKGTPQELRTAHELQTVQERLSQTVSDAETRRPPQAELPRDAALVVERCRLKARALRWQYERDAMPRDRLITVDRELIDAGRALPDCYLWMCQPGNLRTYRREALGLAATCFETLAEAIELVTDATAVPAETGPDEDLLQQLADSQSMLHVALNRVRGTGNDPDQLATFIYLREEGKRRRIFLHHLSLDDPLSPEENEAVRGRLQQAAERLRRRRDAEQKVSSLLRRIDYHASRLAADPPVTSFDDAGHNLRRIAEAVAELLAAGVAPSHPNLRQTLRPVLSSIPEDAPAPLQRVMDSIDAFLDSQGGEEDGETESLAPAETDLLLQEAAQLTAGRHAVLIGGVPNDLHRERLRCGLQLGSLNWIRVEHGESFERTAQPALLNPDVSLVLLMTRWRSHRDGPETRRLCKERGIPLVELPGGYGTRRAAHEILRQAGRTLGVPA